jgi:hypothetical protein
MRKIWAVAVMAAALGAATLAPSASATVVAECASGVQLGAGLPIPAGTVPPQAAQTVGEELTTGPSCSIFEFTNECATFCRATIGVSATAGIVYGRVQAVNQTSQGGFLATSDCGPVIAGPNLPSGCTASAGVSSSGFVSARCTMEGVLAVFPGLVCRVEAPPFTF